MSRNKWLEYVVTEEDAGMTVEQIVREKLSVSGRMVQRLTRSKGIQLNRKPPFLKKQVKTGDRVAVRIQDSKIEQLDKTTLPTAYQLDILYEDEFFIIVNKPTGMMVHPVQQEQTETLVHVLTAYFLEKGQLASIHPVHRLDKQTTGAVLIAKSSYAHQLADRSLREGSIQREYLAILTGRLEQETGTINAPIARDPFHQTKRQVNERGEAAITHYEVVTRSADTTLVRVRLETGKTHQIRVHFQHVGHPIVGDTLYGGERLPINRQALHAHRLSFVHPVSGEEIAQTAALPEDMASFIEKEYGLTM